MVFSTPSVRAATSAEIAPAAAACPAANGLAALTVENTNHLGTHADAAFCDMATANAPPENTTPCRARAFASIVRPRASLPATVPSGQPEGFDAEDGPHLVSISVFDVEPAYHVGFLLDFG